MKFLHEIVTYADGAKRDNGWWEIGDDGYVYNRRGGRHTYDPSPDDEIIEKEDWSDIIKATVRNDNEECGWIAPDGEFFGCARTDHSLMAEFYFGLREIQLEAAGYIKVYELPMQVLVEAVSRGSDTHRLEAYLGENPTMAQKDKLENMGFKPKREGWDTWIK